jgi:2,3-bisphosphoglycerate-independent phosphoglycerate mutase
MPPGTILPIDVRAREAAPVLIVFVDGVGLASDAPGNPFTERLLPGLEALAGGPLVAGCACTEPGRSVSEADATLGVDGLPQSGTGQTTLFTGVNAAQALGRHVPAFPGPRLKAIIEAAGLLAKVRRAGRSVAFANAFTPSYLNDLAAGKRRASVTVHAATCAGVRLRAETDLVRDQAVTWDFERDVYRRAAGEQVPPILAAQAGAHLAALAGRHGLTLYETFLTDLAGHGRIPITAVEAIERVDRFLGGLLAARDERLTVVLCSDHGNVEQPEHGRHTRNRVPVIALGPLAAHFASMGTIVELTPAVLRALGVSDGVVAAEPSSLATALGGAS